MAKDNERGRKLLVSINWNSSEMKFGLTVLLAVGFFATFMQFIPIFLSPTNFFLCSTNHFTESSSLSLLPSLQEEEKIVNGSIIKRSFNPFGSAAYIFVKMGAYRGGMNTFSVIGLASKPLHVYGKPRFECEWVSNKNEESIKTEGQRLLPDWGYGRIYTVVVVNCTFNFTVGGDRSGGRLFLHASTGGEAETTVKIEALREEPGSLNESIFTDPPTYDYLYCGSSLYGNLSPQRIREWLAYHAKLFGDKSHFVFHDAGGVHKEVFEVLKPWINKGYVTLQDIRDQEKFDGYYHNQFLVVNDCLHRYKFMAKWIFFLDVDEYLYIPPKRTVRSVLATLDNYTQFTISQIPMSNKICLSNDTGLAFRKWGFEKLVYRDVKRGLRRDRKYAIQPRNAFAAGVHFSQNLVGKTEHRTETRIMYFHYHGIIGNRREPCQILTNSTQISVDGTPFVLDATLRFAAASIKLFELKTIGTILQGTNQ